MIKIRFLTAVNVCDRIGEELVNFSRTFIEFKRFVELKSVRFSRKKEQLKVFRSLLSPFSRSVVQLYRCSRA